MLQPKQDRPANTAAVAAAVELYDRDLILWSEQQVELLRQVAAGKRAAGIDWTNIIEEIESLGRSMVNAVESLLLQALVHEFKAALWPDTPYVEGWRNESRLFQTQASGQFMPSMRQRIDPWNLVLRAARAAPVTIDGKSRTLSLDLFADSARRQIDRWLAAPDSTLISLRPD